VRPVLVAEIAYTERSAGGQLRQPVWLGLRDDVPAPLALEDERTARGKGRVATAVVDDRAVPVTNLDKVLYPDGTTKRQLLEYAAAIAPVMLPHLRGRALTMVRCPDGVDGERFFEKRAPGHRPDWVATATVQYGRERIEHVLADERATLVWLMQLAALELHPSLALAAEPDRPTAVVFDLAPGAPAAIAECCEVALLLRGMLDGVGLRAFAKTSGSKGLQVYVPLNRPEPSFDDTKAFAKTVAEVLQSGRPDLVVARQAKTLREGRVLVDWYQNDRAKTTIGVYSPRARERPTVSTPVTWDEVEAAADGGAAPALAFTLTEVLQRVEEHGDLFGEVATLPQRLPATG
jgi:bifunctional non-homologous end joining protein LigD